MVAPSGSSARESRVAAHSHIKGLGLGDDGLPLSGTAQGFVGQKSAREVSPRYLNRNEKKLIHESDIGVRISAGHDQNAKVLR